MGLGNPECWLCKGKGWYWANNGPDDIDKEPCENCEDYEYEKKELENGYRINEVSKQKQTR